MSDKYRNYGFWVSLASAVLMMVQALGIKVDAPIVNEIITAVLGVLVALGIISNPNSGSGYIDKK